MSLTISLGKQSLLTSYYYKRQLLNNGIDLSDRPIITSTDHISFTDIFENENHENLKNENYENVFRDILDKTDFNFVCKNDELQELLRKEFEKSNFIPLILIICDQREQKNLNSLLNYLNEDVKKIPLKLVTTKHNSYTDYVLNSFCLHENLELLDGRKSIYFEIEKTPAKNFLSNAQYISYLIYRSQMVYFRNHISIPDYFDILNISGFLPYHNFYSWNNSKLKSTVWDSSLNHYRERDIFNTCQILCAGKEDSYKYLYNKLMPWVVKRSFEDLKFYPNLIKLNGFHENRKISILIGYMRTTKEQQKQEILETLYKIQN